jgi:hypothetical protein
MITVLKGLLVNDLQQRFCYAYEVKRGSTLSALRVFMYLFSPFLTTVPTTPSEISPS